LRLRRPEIGSPENLGALVITRKSCFAVVSLVRYQNSPHNPGMHIDPIFLGFIGALCVLAVIDHWRSK